MDGAENAFQRLPGFGSVETQRKRPGEQILAQRIQPAEQILAEGIRPTDNTSRATDALQSDQQVKFARPVGLLNVASAGAS